VLSHWSRQQLDQALDARCALWSSLSQIESASPGRFASRKQVSTINQDCGRASHPVNLSLSGVTAPDLVKGVFEVCKGLAPVRAPLEVHNLHTDWPSLL
jgi:hypothetical protein